MGRAGRKERQGRGCRKEGNAGGRKQAEQKEIGLQNNPNLYVKVSDLIIAQVSIDREDSILVNPCPGVLLM